MSDDARRRYVDALKRDVDVRRWAALAAAANPQVPEARFDAAVRASRGAVAALVALAAVHRGAGDRDAAEQVLREAVRRAPRDASVLTNHGLLLSELGRHGEAVARQREAVALAPGMAAAWTNLALALHGAGDARAASEAEREAFRLDPGSPQALVGRGLTQHAGGEIGAAIASFRAALTVDATLREAWINLGLALQDGGDAVAARACFEQALALDPLDRRAVTDLLMESQYDATLNAADLRAIAARAERAWPCAEARRGDGAAGRALKVGYLSGDFYAHPVGWLLAPVLEAHDRDVLAVHAFSHTPPSLAADALGARLRAGADHWHDVHGLDDVAIAEAIAAAGIDVLVDLSGHTERGRPGVFALRPAPVQLSWLGYFGSTGLRAIDAVIVGDALAPEGAESFYTEALERVPGAHFVYGAPPDAPAPAMPPSEAPGSVTFGSFNNPAKMGDAVVRTWAQVLAEVPGSRLLLKWRSFADAGFAAATRARFAAHGVDPQRIETRPASPHARLLAEYGDVDIALDPFPFCGLITTLEALWMGVPVVTLRWQRPVSRQTHAVLQAIGFSEWSTDTPRRYVECAAALAADLPLRRRLRGVSGGSLRARVNGSPMADAATLARRLEAIYRRRREAVR